MAEVTTTTAKLELDGFTLTAEGILDEPSEWTITNSSPVRSTSYTRNEYWDEDEVVEALWEEAMFIIRKYSNVVIDHMTEEVEDEDED